MKITEPNHARCANHCFRPHLSFVYCLQAQAVQQNVPSGMRNGRQDIWKQVHARI